MDEELHMIRLNRQPQNLPGMLLCDLLHDRLEAVMNRANEQLPASFRTPNEVVRDQVDAGLFMCIIHVDSRIQQYRRSQAVGPFIFLCYPQFKGIDAVRDDGGDGVHGRFLLFRVFSTAGSALPFTAGL